MKKRIISFILCMAMCCAIFPATAFADDDSSLEGGYYQGDKSPAEIEIQDLLSRANTSEETYFDSDPEENLFSDELNIPRINAIRQDPSLSFMNGDYGKAYKAAKDALTADQLVNLISVVVSQKDYHESDSPSNLAGTSNGTGNYTEYGDWWGNNGEPWGGYFADWCASHAGLNMSFMGMATKPYNSSIYLGKGSIVIISENGSRNIGIVTERDGQDLIVYEGNYSDKVARVPYKIYDPKIIEYATPSYDKWLYEGGYWYFIKANGSKITGWLQSGNSWYYLDPSAGGKMVIKWKDIDGRRFYFNQWGAMLSGWQIIDGSWYYFNTKHDGTFGAMLTGWLLDGNIWYYLKADGKMAANEYLTINGVTYHFDASGHCTNPDGSSSLPGPEISITQDESISDKILAPEEPAELIIDNKTTSAETIQASEELEEPIIPDCA